MTYNEFLLKSDQDPTNWAFKDYYNMTNLLLDDVNLPLFYADVAGLDHMYIWQG
jgi:hypothetical protein